MADEDRRTVFVKLVAALAGYSLPRSVTESDFVNHFGPLKKQVEEVSSIRGRNSAHAFVKFKTPEAASEAIASYNNTHLRDRYRIIVKPFYSNEGNYSPATAYTRQSSKPQQHPLVGLPVTRKSSLKQANIQQQPKQQRQQQQQQQQKEEQQQHKHQRQQKQEQQQQTSQPKVHPRRGRQVPTATQATSTQVSPKLSEHQALSAASKSKSETTATQQKSPIMATSIAQQNSTVIDDSKGKQSSIIDTSAAQQKKSFVVDHTAQQKSSILIDPQDSWPEIVPATKLEPIFLTEPDGMLSEPDSSQSVSFNQPSLKDLLLNPSLSTTAEQIQGSLLYKQSHSPVPIATAGPSTTALSSSLNRVAITNLSTQADEDDLIPFLGLNGRLISLVLVSDGSSKKAIVAYPSLSEAQEAIMKWHGTAIYGLSICVEVIQDETRTPSIPPPGFPSGILPPSFGLPLYPNYPYSIPPQPADIMALMPPTLGTMMQSHMNYSMQSQPNFPTMMPLSSVNYQAPMLQSSKSFPTLVEPITSTPSMQLRSVQRQMSSRLYDFTKGTTEGKEFERNGGSLQYSDGCLLISAHPLKAAENFASKFVDRLCERQLSLSLKQLTQLAECQPNRPSQFDELCSPFTTNPNVKIVLSVEYGQGKEPAVTFVGLAEAVNSAYLHFMGTLLKEFEMNRVQAAAVRQLLPDFLSSLCDELHVKLSFTNETTVCFEGSSVAIQEARTKLQQQLSVFHIHHLATTMSSSLLASLRKRLQEKTVNACVLHFPPDPACVVTLSQKDNNNAVSITRNVFHRSRTLPSANLVKKLKSESGLITTLEQNHTVSATIDNNSVKIEGYNEEDVIAATSALDAGLKDLSIATKQLDCSRIIHSYLVLRLFKQQSTDCESFIASLPVKVLINKDGLIQLEGTPAAIIKGEKELMTRFVPSQLKHRTFEFINDIRFFSLMEDLLLGNQQEKDSTFHYLSATKSKSSSSSESSDETGFSFTIFSSQSKHFEQMCSDLENFQPHTEEIPVHPSLVESLEKRKKTIEHKHSVRLMIKSSKVTIDGLQKEKILNCRKELEETLLISEMICLTGFQVVYLEQKFQHKIAEFRSICQTLSLPKVQRNPKGLTDISFITVYGKPADVECVKKGILDILGNDLKQDTSFIKCACSVLVLWEERWKHVVTEFEKYHDILIWFGQSSSSPKVSGRVRGGQSRHEAALKRENEVVVTFLFYGKSATVDEFKKSITQEENGEVIKEEIGQSADVCQALRDAITKRKAGIYDLSVQVDFPRSGVILLLAPSCKKDDFTTAKAKLKQFIDRMVHRDLVIPCNDGVVALILKKKPSMLKTVLHPDLSRKVDVSLTPSTQIQLTGNQFDIDTAQTSIEQFLSKIRATLANAKISVNPLCKPFFYTKRYRQICSRLEHNKQVVCTCPFLGEQTSRNTVLFQTSFQPGHDALCVQLSLVRGDILKEVVDVIVNPANSKLDHIGGLAKAIADIGGSQIQKESTRYVKENGEVSAGKAICSSPGLLPFKKLIHSVGPRWMGGRSNESFQLCSAVNNSLCVANKENLQSIALPAIGTGVFAVPVHVCAEESHRAVKNFCIYYPRACVKDIRFVLYTEADAREFVKCFKKLISQAEGSGESSIPSLAWKSQASAAAAPPLTEQPLNWLWKNDNHTFSPYDSSTSDVLTQQFRLNPQGSCFITVNAKRYQVDFSAMQQTNMATGFSRNIQIEQETPQAAKPSDPKVQWCYRDDRRQYSPYTPHDSAAIERGYQDNQSIRLTINGSIYLIDFTRMCQVNGRTGYERPIRRQYSDSQVVLQPVATPEDDEEEKSLAAASTTEDLAVNLRGPKENLSKAVKELEQELSNCIKTEQMPLRKAPKSTKKSLKEVAEKHGVQVTFSSKGRTATIKGYGDALDKALLEMQKLVLAKMPEDDIEFPPEWEPQEVNLKLVPIPASSDEWQAVSSRFQSTMPSTTIRSIQRIQNKWLWKKYAQHKKMIEEKNGGASNEMELFHGTRDNMPREIYDSEEGFDMRFSAQGMWGQANYFAVNASYSNGYAHRNTITGYREMFLAKVLTGNSHACGSNSSLRMPPKSYTAGSQLGQARYDTVTGTTGGSQVYMTYDNQKAYPAYLITY